MITRAIFEWLFDYHTLFWLFEYHFCRILRKWRDFWLIINDYQGKTIMIIWFPGTLMRSPTGHLLHYALLHKQRVYPNSTKIPQSTCSNANKYKHGNRQVKTLKTKAWTIRTLIKTESDIRWSERVSMSCSTCSTGRIAYIKLFKVGGNLTTYTWLIFPRVFPSTCI